ncbi:EAL domain-containing protein [Vibrio tapetis subsp. quintayensis]|uniref:putative bifunctional diguanylate cyclase/phosphodiesterase n=1 Tax=Vibrio tapetis TaxID=52443 RepID=UPI0025B308D3|nr:EAL domain-containing protein [Vibrio tapetis]MDN3683044.1 EAL domain-containing protein [Vibrio tapetis subsp. quintayensis]
MSELRACILASKLGCALMALEENDKSNLSETDNEHLEATRLLYANTVAGLSISTIASTALVFGFGNDVGSEKSIWWIMMLIVLSLRAIDTARFRQKSHQECFNDLKLDRIRFSSGVVITSFMWSGYILYFYPFTDSLELTSTMILISAMAGGAANILSGSRATAIFYSIVLLAPFSAFLCFSDIATYQTLGMLGLLFCVVMVLSSNKSATFTFDAIRLKYQNVQLLEQMEKKVEERTEEIYRLSNLDSMTSFLNRKAFIRTIEKELAQHPDDSFALFFIDLDGFKQVNDSMGHEVGDAVIRGTAARISKLCPNPLNKCRWGGDEFLVIKKLNNVNQPIAFAEQVIAEVSKPQRSSQYNTSVGATIGISIYPDHGRDLDGLIQSADMAMYQQKRNGKGKVNYFDESLRMHLLREHYLSDRLSDAIANDELRLVFQPIVTSHKGEITSLEALLRWQLDGEDVPPTELIPIAEQYGLISNIGLWVLETACRRCLQFIEANNELTLSINVSVTQLLDKHFIEKVEEVMFRVGFPPSQLIIEITESVFAKDKDTFLKGVKALQSLGARISIDDFGTGYSSLSSMLDVGVDIVKIDKSFIHNMDDRGISIIQAVAQMASALRFDVIAEGVETKQQAQKLNEIGIGFLQGDYFSTPVEADDVTKLLLRSQANIIG